MMKLEFLTERKVRTSCPFRLDPGECSAAAVGWRWAQRGTEGGNYPNQLADLALWACKSCKGCFVSLTSAGVG